MDTLSNNNSPSKEYIDKLLSSDRAPAIDFEQALEEADKDGELTATLRELNFEDLLRFAKAHVRDTGSFLPQIKSRVRELMILKLRHNDNLSFHEIAKHPLVSMNESAVRVSYYRMLNRFVDPADVADAIKRSVTRLDTVNDLAMELYNPKKPVASTMALNTIINAENRRSKLLGLDAPKQLRIDGNLRGRDVVTLLRSAKPVRVDELKAIQALDPIIKPIDGARIDEESVIPEGDPYQREQERLTANSSNNSEVVENFNRNHEEIEAENVNNNAPKHGIFKVA